MIVNFFLHHKLKSRKIISGKTKASTPILLYAFLFSSVKLTDLQNSFADIRYDVQVFYFDEKGYSELKKQIVDQIHNFKNITHQ